MRGLFIGGALAGFIIGVALGLAIAWVYWPISYTEVEPADLSLDEKDDYIRMIAASYSLDGDLAQAMQRLNVLHLAASSDAVSSLIRREQKSVAQQALVHLSLDLKEPAVALARPTFTPRPTRRRATFSRTPNSAQLTPLPLVTATQAQVETSAPADNITPTSIPPTSIPNPNAPRFQLKTISPLHCGDTVGRTRIQVNVQDADGKPEPGIAIEVNGARGNDIFYTGLKPERGMGYADVELTPGTYSIHLIENAQSNVVTNLNIDDDSTQCAPNSTSTYGWDLTFQQTQQ